MKKSFTPSSDSLVGAGFVDSFVLDQIQPGLEGLQAFLTLEQWYSLLFLGIFVRLEVFFQDRRLCEYLCTHWAR